MGHCYKMLSFHGKSRQSNNKIWNKILERLTNLFVPTCNHTFTHVYKHVGTNKWGIGMEI